MKKITVYTKDYCPYCTKAKALLVSLGAEFKEVDISNSPNIINDLVKKSGLMTMPQIFADDKSLGGCDDIFALHEEGRLLEELGME